MKVTELGKRREGVSVSIFDACVVVLVYTVALLVVAGFPHARKGFPLDDSWIHQVVARNFAENGTLGFIAGRRSSGSSSLLWSLLLAAKWRFMPVMNPVTYTGILGWLSLCATGLGLLGMARRDKMRPAECWIWALTPALDGNFVWLGVIGMEHLLFATLSVLAIYFWFETSTPTTLLCALSLGLLTLTRPEGVVLAALVLLSFRWAGRRRRDLIITAFMVMLCGMAFLVANFVTSASWLPTTFEGRKWLYFGSNHVPLLAKIEFPYVLFRNLLQAWAVRQTHLEYVINLVICLLMLAGARQLWREGRRRSGLLTIWMLLTIAIYSAMLPARSHGGRYQPLFLALNFPLLFVGLEHVVRLSTRSLHGLSPGTMRLQTATTALVCLVCGVFSLAAWRSVTRAGVTLVESTHAPIARYMAANLPPGSKVASFDIGRIGYIYGVWGDMGGLTDRSFLRYLAEHRAFDYLEEHRIDYLVWPVDAGGAFTVGQVVSFTPQARERMVEVAHFCTDGRTWERSYSAMNNAAQCQVLFYLRH